MIGWCHSGTADHMTAFNSQKSRIVNMAAGGVGGGGDVTLPTYHLCLLKTSFPQPLKKKKKESGTFGFFASGNWKGLAPS